MAGNILGVFALLLFIVLIVLALQNAWVTWGCWHPQKEFEAQSQVVFACMRTSWMYALIDAFRG